MNYLLRNAHFLNDCIIETTSRMLKRSKPLTQRSRKDSCIKCKFKWIFYFKAGCALRLIKVFWDIFHKLNEVHDILYYLNNFHLLKQCRTRDAVKIKETAEEWFSWIFTDMTWVNSFAFLLHFLLILSMNGVEKFDHKKFAIEMWVGWGYEENEIEAVMSENGLKSC